MQIHRNEYSLRVGATDPSRPLPKRSAVLDSSLSMGNGLERLNGSTLRPGVDMIDPFLVKYVNLIVYCFLADFRHI